MEHEAIEELLAGYALRALSGEDARQADQLLSDHVPTCATCRGTLTGFQDALGDLALAPDPISPPETLLGRLHRELGPPARGRRPMTVFAVAASVVAVVGMAGLAVSQGVRASQAQKRVALVQDAIDTARQPDATRVPVGPMTEIARPGLQEFYIYGNGVPDPPPGMVYRLWLGSGSGFTPMVDFLPEDGVVILHVAFDPSQFDRIEITQEPTGSVASQPGRVVWAA